ncbi:MAG TPA: response regulator [Polyangiaceae bacterium]|jgi:two-component system chemotaxis response regulator CheY|nr:response regulator [Polyangiaceae bacterium]
MARSVLIVDDSSTVRRQLRTFLEGQGFTVTEGANGREGVDAARASSFDLIIVDVNMPVLDGISMIREVRRLTSHQKTPIFVLTTDSAVSTAGEGKIAGATAWIVKPFKPEVLLKGIQKVFDEGNG